MSVGSFNGLRAILVCSTAALFCSYQFLLQGSPAVMVSSLASSFDLTMTQVGLLSSSFLYAYLLFQVPGGYLADRSNLRLLLVCCCLVMAAACYWLSIAETMLSASMARALMGLATSPSIVVSMTLVSRWFPERWFPTLAGFVETAALAGGALGPVLIPEMMAQGDWRYAMQGMALIGISLACLTWLFVRNFPAGANQHCDKGASDDAVETSGGFITLIQRKDFWLCCLYGFGMFAVLTCFGSLWGVPFLCERYPEHQIQVPQTISMLFIGAAVGSPVIGFLASLTGLYRQLMAISALASMAFSLMAIYWPCSLPAMAGCCFFIGFSCGGYMLVFAAVKKVCPKRTQGVAMAFVNGCLLLGGPIMQPLVGAMLNACPGQLLSVPDYQHAFLPIFIMQFIAFTTTFLLPGINEKKAWHLPYLSRKR